MLPTGSGIPLWAQEIMPRWLLPDRPAFAEFLWAGTVTGGKSLITMFGSLYAGYAALAELKHFDVTLIGYVHVVHHGWFACLFPLLWGSFNGTVAGKKSIAAIKDSTTSNTSVAVSSTKPSAEGNG